MCRRRVKIIQSGAKGRHDPSKASFTWRFVNVYRSKMCVPLMHKLVCKLFLFVFLFLKHVLKACGGEKKKKKERIQVVLDVSDDGRANTQVISSL